MTDYPWTRYGQSTDGGSRGRSSYHRRTGYGRIYGKSPFFRGTCRSAELRGALVVRARQCSSVVRSAFGRDLCGVRLVLVRVAFVRGGRSRGGTRTHNGLAYGLLTDGRWAGIGQTWTNPAIPRWAAARGGWTCHGRETDTPRATHGRFPYGRTTGGRRTGNGHQTGGRWAGIRLMPTFCDIPRWAAACGGRTCDGLLTGGRWAAHGLETGGTRTIPPTGGQRASDGRATDGGRGATATGF